MYMYICMYIYISGSRATLNPFLSNTRLAELLQLVDEARAEGGRVEMLGLGLGLGPNPRVNPNPYPYPCIYVSTFPLSNTRLAELLKLVDEARADGGRVQLLGLGLGLTPTRGSTLIRNPPLVTTYLPFPFLILGWLSCSS